MVEAENPEAARQAAIETLFREQRTFPPPPEFAARANVNDPAIYARAASDFEAYWAGEAARLDWYRRRSRSSVLRPVGSP